IFTSSTYFSGFDANIEGAIFNFNYLPPHNRAGNAYVVWGWTTDHIISLPTGCSLVFLTFK
ncbi:MAG: hypothetical protein V3R13_03810, partial [Nitrososphaerales archaeon]